MKIQYKQKHTFVSKSGWLLWKRQRKEFATYLKMPMTFLLFLNPGDVCTRCFVSLCHLGGRLLVWQTCQNNHFRFRLKRCPRNKQFANPYKYLNKFGKNKLFQNEIFSLQRCSSTKTRRTECKIKNSSRKVCFMIFFCFCSRQSKNSKFCLFRPLGMTTRVSMWFSDLWSPVIP